MKIERLIIGGAALLVGLILGWMVRGVTTYNVHQASIASYDDWRVACPAAVSDDPADVPMLTPYLPPKEKATGTAIVVCPGGAFEDAQALHESQLVADKIWLRQNLGGHLKSASRIGGFDGR